MVLPWGLTAFAAGMLYGWTLKGPAWRWLVVGSILAVLLAGIGWLTRTPALGQGVPTWWTALILAGLFVLGAGIGHVIEAAIGRSRA